MRRRLFSILIAFICLIVGATLASIYFIFNDNDEKTIINRNITVNDNGISEIVSKVESSVVVIETYSNNSLRGTGSGFVYKVNGNDAFIMTNHHVIENSDKIKLTFVNGEEVMATLVGSDEYADIAVLKVSKDKILSVLEIGSSKDTKKGDIVFAIGSPMGIEYSYTVTKGILSGKDRLVSVSISGYTNDWIMNVMQTDAAISPGNSGGPLCNTNGEAIGIISLKIVESTVEGIGFAIPIEDAMLYADSIVENGFIERPYIGISMINASNRYQLSYANLSVRNSITEGVVLATVEKNSPAEKAGLKVEDVIVKVGEYKVKDIAEFRYRLYSNKIGDIVELTVNRMGEEIKIKVKLGSNN